MIDYFMSNPIVQLVVQSDVISKIILAILFGMSVLTWAVFLGKICAIRSKKKQLHNILRHMQTTNIIQEMRTIHQNNPYTLPGYFIHKIMGMYDELRGRSEIASKHNWEALQRYIEQQFDGLIDHEETYLPIISTSAAVAPLLGLLGTVWGLVHSFVRISELRVADIATVAPGIAEALITTFAGLVVAIPALVMYNYLIGQIRRIEYLLMQLADRVSFVIQPHITGQ